MQLCKHTVPAMMQRVKLRTPDELINKYICMGDEQHNRQTGLIMRVIR